MRYEVRKPDGKFIGLYSGPAVTGHQQLQVLSPKCLISAQSLTVVPTMPMQQVTLEPALFMFGAHDIPTLVLRGGKRSWLNGVKGFRRI